MTLRHFCAICTALLAMGCVPKVNVKVQDPFVGPPEEDFCSTSTTYAGGVTVSGTAEYIKRMVWVAGGSGGLGSALTADTSPAPAHPATILPIRQAEVRVTNAAGQVVQCATTNDSGAFSLTLPQGNVTYTLSVNSRAYNTKVRVSVLDAPNTNKYYSLSTSVNASSNTTGIELIATASSSTLGGAFNILDQIYETNLYLRGSVSSCSSTYNGCQDVNDSNVVPKVQAYWKAGFNPNTYLGRPESGLSYYLPDYNMLFILGGIDGDMNNADTDHYDDTIIIHEYGHFLEDVIGQSDSQGGAHFGNQILDPRLAWSEAWGNLIQAAVRGDGRYIDTIGNDDGMTDFGVYIGLESAGSTPGQNDYPNFQGEGNFREFSITRLLWDAVDTSGDTQFSNTDGVSLDFPTIWAALSSTTVGLRASKYAFRNVGLVHEIQRSFASVPSWSSLRAMERHDGNTSQYAQYVSTSCAGTSPAYASTYYYQIAPATIFGDNGSLAASDLLRNNDFYHLRITSAGTYTIRLQWADANSLGQKADLDLYVYNESANFGLSTDWVGYSREGNASSSASTLESETVTVTLNPGDYLLNVFVYTGSGAGTPANYNILLNNSPLCPRSLVQ